MSTGCRFHIEERTGTTAKKEIGMGKKNIVSIEDRIPKLKQARKKKANRRLFFYLGLFAVLISLIVYLQSPLSHVQHVKVYGNSTIEKEKIKSWSELTSSDNFWSVNNEEIKEKISAHPEIEEASVSKKLFSTIEINVKEFERVGYLEEEGVYYPVLSNGELLKGNGLETISGDAPILYSFQDNEYLVDLAEELHRLPKNVSGLISEIAWEPTEENPYKVRLYMNDGHEVQGTIRSFASNMEAYPSIVSQLDPTLEGVLHLGVGAYFEPAEEASNELDPEAVNEEVAVNEDEQ